MRVLALTMLTALLCAGCADPYAQPATTAPVAGELPAPPVAEPRTHRPTRRFAASSEAAVRRAVELTANWTEREVARQHEVFAAATTGAARRDAQRVAAQAATDPQLTAGRSRSVAVLHAVVPRGGGPQRRLLVVTHETLITDELRQARFRVTLAEAQHVGEGWVLSRWEPQP